MLIVIVGGVLSRLLRSLHRDLSDPGRRRATPSSGSPTRGIHGNGHMMMLEKNSDAIAGVIDGWLKTLPAKPAGRSAQR